MSTTTAALDLEPISSDRGQRAEPRCRLPPPRRLEAVWADSEGDVRAAQRLRHRVFAVEMGACLAVVPGTPPGHDADRFDPHCEHLLIRAARTDLDGDAHAATDSDVIGTYRVMTPAGARRAGGCYSETEFDMERLEPIRPRMLELGRSCIDPAWRTGGAILMLWSAIGEFMLRHRLDICFGAASIGLADGGLQAASVWRRLASAHLAPDDRRVRPLRPLPPRAGMAAADDGIEMPPLIKGYVRCGAELLGPPAWDADFDCADLPMLMPLSGLPQRHRRHFLGDRG